MSRSRANGSAQAKDWLQEDRRLQKRAEAQGRLVQDFYRQSQARTEGVDEVYSLWSELTGRHHGHQREIGGQLDALRTSFGTLKATLERALGVAGSEENPHALDLDEKGIQELLERLEARIREFKSHMRAEYADLMEQEGILSREIVAFQQRSATWEKESPEELAARMRRERRDVAEAKASDAGPQETGIEGKKDAESADGVSSAAPAKTRRQVADIDHQIERLGGAYGGWHAREHEAFLRLWTKIFGLPHTGADLRRDKGRKRLRALTDAAATVLFERSREEVRDYAEWYVEFLSLQQRKKDAIAKWREDTRKAQEEAKRKEEEHYVNLHPTPTPEALRRQQQEAEAKKRKLKKWHEAKLKKEEEGKKAREENERRKRMEELRRRKNFQAKKEKLAAHQLMKEREREAEERRRVLMARMNPTERRVDLSERVRSDLDKARAKGRDAQLKASGQTTPSREVLQKRVLDDLTRRALNGDESTTSEDCVAKHASAPQVRMAWLGVTRDASRATGGTHAWQRREYSEAELDRREEHRERAGAHDRMIPLGARDRIFVGRAVPSWRQGIS